MKRDRLRPGAFVGHEREALAWLRSRLPDREPFHVWADFEFTARQGQLYEIDALAITGSVRTGRQQPLCWWHDDGMIVAWHGLV